MGCIKVFCVVLITVIQTALSFPKVKKHYPDLDSLKQQILRVKLKLEKQSKAVSIPAVLSVFLARIVRYQSKVHRKFFTMLVSSSFQVCYQLNRSDPGNCPCLSDLTDSQKLSIERFQKYFIGKLSKQKDEKVWRPSIITTSGDTVYY